MLRNLKSAIIAAGYNSIGQFADDINMSRQSLSGKINENVEFTAREVKKVLEVLRNSDNKDIKVEFDYIFLSDSPENGTRVS